MNIANLITPSAVRAIFKDMEMKLVHEDRYNGDGGRIHEVTAVLSYKGEPILTSNRITVSVPEP